MFTLGLIIGGGTSQIQKNIITSAASACREGKLSEMDFGLSEDQEAAAAVSAREFLRASARRRSCARRSRAATASPRRSHEKMAEHRLDGASRSRSGRRARPRHARPGASARGARPRRRAGAVPLVGAARDRGARAGRGSSAQKKAWLPRLVGRRGDRRRSPPRGERPPRRRRHPLSRAARRVGLSA